MTKWFHECDFNWLKARQTHLTATDIRELLPVTKTGRKRVVTDEHYIKVLSNKLVNLTEDDCISTGAAARGHILEPYAIEHYNENRPTQCSQLYHWDDVIVSRDLEPFSLAFSPDAMNIEQREFGEIVGFNDIKAKAIGEVKSYSAERHMIAGCTPSEKLEERWQVAAAMAVCDTINEAHLLFYNPSMMAQMFIVDYDREDLADEIEIVLEIEENWNTWIGNFGKLRQHYTAIGSRDKESEIIQEIMKREELNPEGKRSVIQ